MRLRDFNWGFPLVVVLGLIVSVYWAFLFLTFVYGCDFETKKVTWGPTLETSSFIDKWRWENLPDSLFYLPYDPSYFDTLSLEGIDVL